LCLCEVIVIQDPIVDVFKKIIFPGRVPLEEKIPTMAACSSWDLINLAIE